MRLILPTTATVIWLFVLWRVIFKLPIRPIYRILLALILLPIANYHQIVGHFFGSLTSPELPTWVMIVLAWLFGIFLLIALLALVRDVIALAFMYPLPKISKKIFGSNKPNIMILLLSIFLSAFGVWQAVKVPNVKTISLHLKNLPAEFNDYRLVQLSDLHASSLLPRDWQAAVVRRVNALRPDLIVITGDLADGSVSDRYDDIQPWSKLKAKDGVLAIPGNHEYYTDYVSWIKALKELDLTVLENQSVEIKHKGASVVFAGLTDRQAKMFAQTPPDLSAALADAADAPVIVLQHRPDQAREYAQSYKNVMLLLSGHTHGGQIIGPNMLTKMANNGFLSGVYQLGDMTVYVSNGTGLWHGLAIRLGVNSEITQIVLKAE